MVVSACRITSAGHKLKREEAPVADGQEEAVVKAFASPFF